jgi:hypothetical protein
MALFGVHEVMLDLRPNPRYEEERKSSIFWPLFSTPIIIALVILGAHFL